MLDFAGEIMLGLVLLTLIMFVLSILFYAKKKYRLSIAASWILMGFLALSAMFSSVYIASH